MRVRCLNCGHEWETSAKKPQCPKCKKYRYEVIQQDESVSEPVTNHPEQDESQHEQDESKDEPKDEQDEDLTKDVKGEDILEKPKKAVKRSEKKKEDTSKVRKVINVLLIVGAVLTVGYFFWFWILPRLRQPEEKEPGGGVKY